jgi:hypothetical protein
LGGAIQTAQYMLLDEGRAQAARLHGFRHTRGEASRSSSRRVAPSGGYNVKQKGGRLIGLDVLSHESLSLSIDRVGRRH